MYLGIFIGWIILSILAGVGAKNKGRSFAGFFFLSLLLSPLIGLIAMAVAKPAEEQEPSPVPEPVGSAPSRAPKGAEITCPNCGNPKIAGDLCPTCGSHRG